MNYADILNILKEQVKPAIGCTEPVAVAIAVSTISKELEGDLEEVSIKTSMNIFKNGMRVGIPGTNHKGIKFAAALSIICGDSALQLEIFKNVDKNSIALAENLIANNKIKVSSLKRKDDFYIEVVIKTSMDYGKCIIKENHTNVVLIEKNGIVLLNKDEEINKNKEDNSKTNLLDINIINIIDFIENVDYDKIKFMLDGAKMNLQMSEYGIKKIYSSGLGYTLNRLIENNIISRDIANRIRAATAAACDARMAGVKNPVMSSAGSGNHGITAIIPVAIVCEEYKYSHEKLARALALSHLITYYIKQYTGNLSPICGCSIAAGIGASSAITWLLGGDVKTISIAINNMMGSLSGMLCDGAKGGCSYKVAVAATEAFVQAQLAMEDTSISQLDGIIGMNAEESILNLGKISKEAMKDVDKIIIDIISQAN